MHRGKVLTKISIALIILWSWFLVAPMMTFAKELRIEADGYYIVGDGPAEDPNVARARARQDAKRAASDRAGVYIRAISESKDAELTRDEVKTISATFMRIINESITIERVEDIGGLVFQYHCHLEVIIDTKDDVEDVSRKPDKEIEKERKRTEKELEDLNKKDKPQPPAPKPKDEKPVEDLNRKKEEPITPPKDIAKENPELNKRIEKLTKDREKFTEAVRQTKEIEQESERLDKEIKQLKENYKTTSEAEKQKIKVEVKRNEEKFMALQWNEQGLEHYNRKEYNKAIECYQNDWTVSAILCK